MDEEIKKEFPYEIRVKLEGFRKYKGFSDLLTTYCCSATPCYFVVFPGIEYEGYFEKRDVIALRLRLVYNGVEPMELTNEAHLR